MKIHFSSATIQSYENKSNGMDLFFNPILVFENPLDSLVEQVEDIMFTIESKEFGVYDFDIEAIKKPKVEDEEDKIFLEFKLSKRDVSFVYDDYSCKITLFINIKTLEGENIEVKHEIIGIVKTKWTKGLIE